jgi:predicted RNA-binding protein YlxR (DUF448 family)
VRLALREQTPAGAGPAAVVVDHAQRLPGRGTYVCGAECLRRAPARGRLGGSFRRAVSIDPQTVESVG